MKREHWRINFVFIVILLIAFAILSKLFFIQVVDSSFYRALAEGQQKWFLESQGKRGEIFLKDKTGKLYVAATNHLKKVCFQKNENDAEEECEEKEVRIYPQKKLAAQVIGFLGGEGKGQYGIEGFYDNLLQGKKGWLIGERNPWDFSVGIFQNDTEEGADLILTLEYNIQQMAELLLRKAEEDFQIEEGEIIVLDPNTGKILALANFPSFDLNEYNKVENQEIFQNGALQKLFEPGSVFKPIVIGAGLEEKKITPKTTYNDEGFVKIGGYIIYNYGEKVWGKQTMEQVLERSINTGAVFVERLIGNNKFLEYLKKFGFFEPTFIDLQGEIYSENKNLKTKRDINLATASFGQGVEVTSLQLVRAFAAIANGGKLFKPYVVERIIKPDGKIVKKRPEIQKEKIISRKTADQLTAMLVSVIEKGSGKRAKIPGYYIAGKTGTAQVPFSALGIEKPGYSKKTIQSFVGFFPAFNPQFLILVKLNNPKTKTAEYSAVPLFHELAKYIIDYWEIHPDYEK